MLAIIKFLYDDEKNTKLFKDENEKKMSAYNDALKLGFEIVKSRITLYSKALFSAHEWHWLLGQSCLLLRSMTYRATIFLAFT